MQSILIPKQITSFADALELTNKPGTEYIDYTNVDGEVVIIRRSGEGNLYGYCLIERLWYYLEKDDYRFKQALVQLAISKLGEAS